MIEHVNSLSETLSALKKLRADTQKLMGETDRQVNDLYHIIEFIPLNAAKASQVLKELREALILRRKYKEQNIALNNMLTANAEAIKEPQHYEKESISRTTKYQSQAEAAFKRLFNTNHKPKLRPISKIIGTKVSAPPVRSQKQGN